jgi:hypothetical protein
VQTLEDLGLVSSRIQLIFFFVCAHACILTKIPPTHICPLETFTYAETFVIYSVLCMSAVCIAVADSVKQCHLTQSNIATNRPHCHSCQVPRTCGCLAVLHSKLPDVRKDYYAGTVHLTVSDRVTGSDVPNMTYAQLAAALEGSASTEAARATCALKVSKERP